MSKDTGFGKFARIINSPSELVQGLYEQESSAKHKVGTVYRDHYGRSFSYAKVGGSNVSRGQMLQAPVPVGDHTNIALTASSAVAGAKEVVIATALSTTLSDEQYHDGLFHVNDADSEGGFYLVKEHTDTTTPTITLYDALDEALAATSEWTLTANPYNGAVVIPANPTAMPIGIPLIDLTAAYYGWVQTYGMCACLVDSGDTIVPGDIIGTPGTPVDAGACGVSAATSNWGWALVANAATEYASVFLTLKY